MNVYPTTYREQASKSGSPTFTNPHNASGSGPRIAVGAYVEVQCRVYAPEIKSANPDGWWYKIASSPWSGAYYAVANNFRNGDVPGQSPPYHNTDFNVPICGSGSTGTAGAARAATSDNSASDAQTAADEAYWTPERMMAAAPADGISNEASQAQSVGHSKRVGKIFYHYDGLADGSCTGTVVTSNSRDSILTAAHCLLYHGVNSGHLVGVFVPAYYKGQAPYGKWGIKMGWTGPRWAVPDKWFSKIPLVIDSNNIPLVTGNIPFVAGNPSYDYGVIHVVSHNHVRIQSVTGANPFDIHAGWNEKVTLVGYPSNRKYSIICGPTQASQKTVPGHKPEYQVSCPGFSAGVSGSPVLIGPGNTLAGEGTVIGVLGGLREGGDPKTDHDISYANRLDGDFEKFWNANTR